jgi:hypothetical protein
LVYAITGWAKQNDYSISVNGHRINTTSFKQQVEQLSAVQQRWKIHLGCNFPHNWGTKELKNQGITFFIVSNNAYMLLSILSFIVKVVSKNRTAITIDSSFKIDQLL